MRGRVVTTGGRGVGVRLAILGGGGFRVPLVYGALLADRGDPRIDTVVLHDADAGRVEAIRAVLRSMAGGDATAPRVLVEPDVAAAVRGADFVFSAIRVGGLTGRTLDEHIPLGMDVLGQETTGAGGVCYGLRTVPVAVRIAETVGEVAPDAWVINFTNPAGMVTEAMSHVLGDRVIGICDSPVAMCRRVARALRLDPDRVDVDYAGLNHLGWLRALYADGRDRLPELFADEAALLSFEEGALFGATWLRALGAVPNEYLYYYYFEREAVRAIRAQGQTRGEFLLQQQTNFYDTVAGNPGGALAEWQRVRAERDATYMQESRTGSREQEDADSGGYEGVALALMAAIARDEQATLILNVRNRSAIPSLDPDAVVEVPCVVSRNGARPLAVGPLTPHQGALVQAVKLVERETISAARSGSRASALRALALHPLVPSVALAESILDTYLAAVPELHAAFGPPAGPPGG